MALRIMRFKEVREVTGLSKTTINRFEKKRRQVSNKRKSGPKKYWLV